MHSSQNMEFFGKSIYIFFSILALFFPFAFPFYIHAVLLPNLSSFFRMDLWLANLLEKGQVTWFFVYNVVRIGKNFRNEVSVERSTFADVSAYQPKVQVTFRAPKSKIQIEIYRIRARVVASKLAHSVFVTAKLLKTSILDVNNNSFMGPPC